MSDRRSGSWRILLGRVLMPVVGVWFAAITADALDATWSAAPTGNDWDTGTNWVGSAVPTGTAYFGPSTGKAITFLADTTIGALQFNLGASGYSFTLAVHSLTITGAGISDTLSFKPTFSITGQPPASFGLAYAARICKIEVTPSLRATWQHEYLYGGLPVTAHFTNSAGNAFTVVGPAEGHNSALISADINLQWTPTIGIYFGYNGQIGRSR